ncbi:TauD/TfdA family dioxygenase, partial [Legionella sp.]|uniref:TauD/TfdA family dioxygenase n=1 Tax=Legionella sp. TaxID=459 RepID=UPI003CB292EA
RVVLSEEKEMPLVIEAEGETCCEFLQQFVAKNATKLLEDMANYGAILLRGFDISSDEQFEKTILSIPDFCGISEAFMSENGRDHVKDSQFVLQTNSIYKTGGTLYLGGFHTENYYSADVPAYICFCCLEPSKLGGETGIINTAKIYQDLNEELKKKLEKNAYFVSKWLVTKVAERYKISTEKVEQIAQHFQLPIIGEGTNRFILMYKPSVFEHPLTKEKALAINLFELPKLNKELRKCFMTDYQGTIWFWHRFFWKLPTFIFNSIEFLAVIFIAFFKSPKHSYKILCSKFAEFKANKMNDHFFNSEKVGSCFNAKEVKNLARLMRNYYSSCIWKKGDILLIDNRKIMHAGMPGKGPRLIRAMIGNPIEMEYICTDEGNIDCKERVTGSIGACMASGKLIHID